MAIRLYFTGRISNKMILGVSENRVIYLPQLHSYPIGSMYGLVYMLTLGVY